VRPAARSPSPARRERGTKGVRAIQRACLFTLALGKTAPAAEILCQAVVPLSDPPLGVNATHTLPEQVRIDSALMFQWAPTLGGECYFRICTMLKALWMLFQWAPTLGGECYTASITRSRRSSGACMFQWAPTLGGECYFRHEPTGYACSQSEFQWAPTLGGECYPKTSRSSGRREQWFQWAPTLGGECYAATRCARSVGLRWMVSMGTHPC
jgi:hypothetical protein